MTHAELLRSHADAALREGGMYYSGEYLSRMASVAESLEAENAKLWKLANGYEALTATLCNERGCDGCQFNDTEQIVCEHMRLQTCLAELEIGKEKKDGMEA